MTVTAVAAPYAPEPPEPAPHVYEPPPDEPGGSRPGGYHPGSYVSHGGGPGLDIGNGGVTAVLLVLVFLWLIIWAYVKIRTRRRT